MRRAPSRPAGARRRSTIIAMAADHATDAEEEYLQTLFWLQEAGLPMTGANVARAMRLSAPDRPRDGRPARARRLHHARLRQGDQRSPTTVVEHAESIVSRHRLIERFLTDVVGVPWDDVHEEAEHLEHAMSPRFEAYVRAAVGRRGDVPARPSDPARPPDRGRAAGRRRRRAPRVRVLRFENEAEDLLHYLKDTGLAPGLEGRVTRSSDGRGQRRAGRRRVDGHPQRGRDGLRPGRPVAAAPHRAARAARARQGPLRPLS